MEREREEEEENSLKKKCHVTCPHDGILARRTLLGRRIEVSSDVIIKRKKSCKDYEVVG